MVNCTVALHNFRLINGSDQIEDDFRDYSNQFDDLEEFNDENEHSGSYLRDLLKNLVDNYNY